MAKRDFTVSMRVIGRNNLVLVGGHFISIFACLLLLHSSNFENINTVRRITIWTT